MTERNRKANQQHRKILLADQLVLAGCMDKILGATGTVSLRRTYREDPTGSREIETAKYHPIIANLDEKLIGRYSLPFAMGQLVSIAFRRKREITTEVFPTTTSELVRVRSGVQVASFDAPKNTLDYSSLGLTLHRFADGYVSSRITQVPQREIHAVTLEQTQFLGYAMAAMETLHAQGLQ